MTVPILQHIHQKLLDASREAGHVIGECPIISPQEENQYLATIYIWDLNFDNATLVASWFEELGASNISIVQVMHDADNDIENGISAEGDRTWHIGFALP